MTHIADTETIKNLQALMKAKFPTLIAAYLKSLDQYMSEIECGHKEGDMDKIKAAAHTLKSASANVGAFVMSEIMAKAETAATTQNKKDLDELLDPTIHAAQETRSAFEKFV